jgi:hypothetical protein
MGSQWDGGDDVTWKDLALLAKFLGKGFLFAIIPVTLFLIVATVIALATGEPITYVYDLITMKGTPGP